MQSSIINSRSGTDVRTIDRVFIGLVPLGLWLFFLGGDWIVGIAPFVLWVGWRVLARGGELPVLALAFTNQWVQVVIGLYYCAFTARRLPAMQVSTCRTMILLGLGCLLALVFGLGSGQRLVARWKTAAPPVPRLDFGAHELAIAYVTMLLTSGLVSQFAWQIPAFTQAILALGYLRLGLLFVIFRRLIRPEIRWGWIGLLMVIECGLGATGYFAGFREPLMILGASLLEAFDRRSTKQWVLLATVTAIIISIGIWWTGIKKPYRAEFRDNDDFSASRELRLKRLFELSSDWLSQDADQHYSTLDDFVDRMWQVYYPSLALQRVPEVIPHSGGKLLWSAIMNVLTPRFIYANKAIVRSDSELVRTYAGVMVNGYEENTSFAFGYAAESYVDFGVPWMFIPVFAWGFIMGALYAWFLRTLHNLELATAVVTIVFWFSLYLYERSWLFTFGMSGAMVIYVGGFSLIFDGFLQRRRRTNAFPVLQGGELAGVHALR